MICNMNLSCLFYWLYNKHEPHNDVLFCLETDYIRQNHILLCNGGLITMRHITVVITIGHEIQQCSGYECNVLLHHDMWHDQGEWVGCR